MSGDGHVLRARPGEGDGRDLLAPSVGVFTPVVVKGQLVSPGQSIGTIEVLGVSRPLLVPPGVTGEVTRRAGEGSSRVPVQYDDVLVRLTDASLSGPSVTPSEEPEAHDDTLSFVAPMSGRFYSRPSPTEPPFVSSGDTVAQGQTIGLLEVMKTFNRLVYQGETLPDRAVVERIVPEEGDDVARGDIILLLASNSEC